MNPEQALTLLDSLTGQINLSRQQHSQVIIAVRTLHQAIAPQVDAPSQVGPQLVDSIDTGE